MPVTNKKIPNILVDIIVNMRPEIIAINDAYEVFPNKISVNIVVNNRINMLVFILSDCLIFRPAL